MVPLVSSISFHHSHPFCDQFLFLRPVSLESAPCVHWLGSGGVVMVGTLTVAFLSPTEDVEVGLKKLKELCSKGVYMGADILLTPEWPAGLASTLPPNGPHM